MVDMAFIWILIGGFLEPVWVIALKKFNEKKNLFWGVASVFFVLLSPACLSLGMKTMPVGVSYAIWTGIGAVFTLLAGMLLYKERIDRLKVMFVFMIIVGVVGLELSGGL